MTPDDHLNPVSTPLSHIAAPWRNTTSRSMGRRGNPYDNGQGEGFLKTIKCEEVYLGDYKTYADVIAHLPYFIDEVYNTRRLHSALDYRSPARFEELYAQQL
jgi:putative transposase